MPSINAANRSTFATTTTSTQTTATLTHARFAGDPELTNVARGTSSLRVGSRGEGVRAVQQALVDMGFSMHCGADGAYGQQAAKAVRNFQVHARPMFPDVEVTGIVDAATLHALDALAPAPGQKGQRTNLPRPVFQGHEVRIIVVKDEHRTYKFDRHGNLEAIVGNAIGKETTPTPAGLRKVTGFLDAAGTAALARRKGYPTTVYGHKLIDLSKLDGSRAGQELHGTDSPKVLGTDASSGCVRHLSTDVDLLARDLRIGDKVAIVNSLRDLQVDRPAIPNS